MPPVDADIFPHATGTAERLVARHRSDAPLVLYAGWFCPEHHGHQKDRSPFLRRITGSQTTDDMCRFVQRVWAILEEKQIPYKYVEVNPYHKQPEFLALNPRGLVPTLEYDNKPLYESTVISEFLDDAYPDHKPKLLSDSAFERAIQRIWIDFVTSRLIPAFHRFLQHEPGVSGGTLDEAQAEYRDKIKEYAQAMDKTGPFFSGKEPSIVDFQFAPWALRHWGLEIFKGGLGIPQEGQGGEDEETWNRWRRWEAAITGRPSLVETMSDREHYMPIYQRYAENKAQSELAKATRSGRGVP